MSREEMIKELKTVYLGDSIKMREAKNMAIKAWEQEPCGDCVSRQAVLDKMKERDEELSSICPKDIKDLPSVTPQMKMGHWIEDTNGTYTDNHDTWECSECGHAQILLEGTPIDNDYNYCPNCGAKMQEVEG